MAEKIIRDPVHDVIAFRLEHPTDALLFRLLGAVELQRLRRIRQLGLASLAYPGADHSRYSHSLGVMQTARRMIEQLRRSYYMADDDVTVVLAAALLHDLGHGPFSHVFERVSGVRHERLTECVILDPESQVHQILSEHDRSLPRRIVDLMQSQEPRSFYADVLSSQLDADRLDYLLRDNLMTGSQYGNYDLTWLLHALTIDEKSNRLSVHAKGVSALEAYLQSRYHMYRNVYFHKVVRSAEGMVKLALKRARQLTEEGQLEWSGDVQPVRKALLGEELTNEEFVELDDISIQHCFKRWARAEDQVLANLCAGLLHRRIYKTVDLSRIAEPSHVQSVVKAVTEAIESAGADGAFEFFYDEPSNMPHASEIQVKMQDGSLCDFASISPLPRSLDQQLMFRRLHVAPKWRDLVEDVLEEQIKSSRP